VTNPPAAAGAVPAANAVPTPNDAAAAAAAGTQVPPAGAPTDAGFPADTPLEQMTEGQRTAYWKHYARKHEDAVKAYKLTPQQVAELQAKAEQFENDKLSADEKTLKAAKQEAADAAKGEFLPKLQRAEVKSIAAEILKGDALKTFLSIVDPAAFVGADGEIDESKVMGALTGMFGAPQQHSGPRWQNAGQFAPPAPAQQPGANGRAEATKRYGKKT